jgi:HEAT repeat protein
MSPSARHALGLVLALMIVALAILGVQVMVGRRADILGESTGAASSGGGLDARSPAALPPRQRDGLAERERIAALQERPDAIAALRQEFERGANGATREQALLTAAKRGDPSAATWLASVAASGGPLAPRAAAALGTVRNPEARPALEDVAFGDGPAMVRANALRALGAVGGSSLQERLTAIASKPSEPVRVRQEAVATLGTLRFEAADAKLADILDATASENSPETEQLRIAVVRALGQIATARARDALARHESRALSVAEAAFTRAALGRARPSNEERGEPRRTR